MPILLVAFQRAYKLTINKTLFASLEQFKYTQVGTLLEQWMRKPKQLMREREERDLENCDFLPLPQVTLQLVHFPYFQKYSGTSTSFSKLEPLRTVYSYFIPGLFSWKRSWTTFIVHFNHKISNQNTLFSVFRTTRLEFQRGQQATS